MSKKIIEGGIESFTEKRLKKRKNKRGKR